MKLAEARATRLFSVERLAREAGVNRATIYSIESGKRLPNLDTVRKIAETLELTDPKEVDEFREAIDRSIRGKDLARIS